MLYPLDNTKLTNTRFALEHNNFKILGITLGRNKEINQSRNIIAKNTQIDYTLARWSQRQLSLVGKILITKSHAISKMIHTMSITEVPKDKLKDIQQKVSKFVYSRKPPKVRQNVMVCQ